MSSSNDAMTPEVSVGNVEAGALWFLVERFQETARFRPTMRMMAAEMGVSHATLADWKYHRVALPKPAHLKALAHTIDVPYRTVLDAALMDAGYLSTYSNAVLDVRDVERVGSDEPARRQ